MSKERIVTAAVLIVVLGIQETSANEYWNCTMDEGVPHFSLGMVRNSTITIVTLSLPLSLPKFPSFGSVRPCPLVLCAPVLFFISPKSAIPNFSHKK